MAAAVRRQLAELEFHGVGDGIPIDHVRALESLAWIHVGGSRIEALAPLDRLPGLVVAGPDDRESPNALGESGGRAGQR